MSPTAFIPGILVRRIQLTRSIAAFALFLTIAAIYTRPLLSLRHSHIASDPGDPVFTASILWWNATSLPLSKDWWNPPFFHLTRDATAFSENLLGVSVIATPIYWLTGNPLTTYNLALFLTWPLSAFAVYLLVRFLVKREDAAVLAGLAFGFTPYRIGELPHIQMLSSYWMPLVLLGLHGYLAARRARWLVLFGLAWMLQSLANAYLLLFGAVLIVMWLLFFCSTRTTWRALGPILAAWSAASVPLAPIFLKYRAVHEYYGLRRDMLDPMGFSAPLSAWLEGSNLLWLWDEAVSTGRHQLFPGIVALVVVGAALLAVALRPQRPDEVSRSSRTARASAAAVTILSLGATWLTLATGPWRVEFGALVVRMSNINRALALLVLGGMTWLLITARTRQALFRRSPFMFYVGAAIVLAVLSCGPVLRSADARLFEPAPYWWLRAIPGFAGIRVPQRFWILGLLCLAIALGLALRHLPFRRRSVRTAFTAAVAGGLLADGWVHRIPMVATPERLAHVEPVDPGHQPILELPLGPEDTAATFRSVWHRRPVFNGVSGYDPPHYAPLQSGLAERDPDILAALASFGSFDVVINRESDPNGDWVRYVSRMPGARHLADEGARASYRIPALPHEAPVLGPPLPIARAHAFRHVADVVIDGRYETEWGDDPQRPGQRVVVDLGAVRDVAGVTHALGEYARDFPRLLAIDVSIDAVGWEQVWQGRTAALAFRAAVSRPREAAMQFVFPSRRARFIRLRQEGKHQNMWRVSELQVHAPTNNVAGRSRRRAFTSAAR
jgi:hypothetical protein